MPGRILIVTHRSDLHADVVARKLAASDIAAFRLNLDEFPGRYEVVIRFSGDRWSGYLRHLPSGEVLEPAEIGAVWLRKKAAFRYPSGPLAGQEKAYADAELEHVLLGLLHSLDCYWMSHPRALRGAQWKIEQLQRAASLGFAVPPSLVSNRRAEIEAFRRTAPDGIVFKTLSSASLALEEVPPEERIAGTLPTTRIAAEHDAMLDAVEELPGFFQHYMPKRHEVRATVIGDRIFAARIHSQDDPRTRVDWRDMSAEIRYEAETLPGAVERRCLDLVASYGLTFGAIDLIVTPDGEYVFLENNPGGQFLFVEQLVPELDMSGALAACLVAGARAHARS